MSGRTRSALFLMEQLIVIVIFAVASAVCAQIFTAALIKSSDAKELNHALIAAKNGAETFRAYGDPKTAVEAIGGSVGDSDSAVVWYDKDWRVCPESEAVYFMRLSATADAGEPSLSLCELTVESIQGDEIFALTVARRLGAVES